MTRLLTRDAIERDEPRLVDNPFRRESHRPWYARRGPRWVVALCIAALFGLNAFAFKEVGTRADPISVDTAIARFRAATADSATGAQGTAPTTVPEMVPAPEAPAAQRSDVGAGGTASTVAGAPRDVGVVRGPTPAPGVYVYDTSGSEEVSALGGARHDYPSQSTITLTDNGCGMTLRWAPLEQRFDEWTTCSNGSQIVLPRYVTHHEFFGQTEERVYQCTGVDIRPPSDDPGTTSEGGCTNAKDTARAIVTVVGSEVVTVQGQAVPAIRLHLEQYLSGESRGSQISELWLRASDGLLLRYETVVDGDANTVIGPTHFHEVVSLALAELEPRG